MVGILVGMAVFIVAAQWSQQYSDTLQAVTTDSGWYGVVLYIVILAGSIVIAPIGTGFLVPVAATSFGPLWAALYSIIGWTIGSIIAFWLARHVQYTFFKEHSFITQVQAYEKKLPPLYWYSLIVVLRMALPVDVISYALGAASSIKMNMFIVTTVLGITPFTFLFTYASVSTIWIQIAAAILGISMFLWGVYFANKTFFQNR